MFWKVALSWPKEKERESARETEGRGGCATSLDNLGKLHDPTPNTHTRMGRCILPTLQLADCPSYGNVPGCLLAVNYPMTRFK